MQKVKGMNEQSVLAQIELVRRRCMKPDGFLFFVNNVFSASFDEFIHGDYIDNVCRRMQSEDWTMDITARDHFKSTRLYAEIMYDIFTCKKNLEAHYFSYNKDLSRYHMKKLKLMIQANPFFTVVKDLNERAESQLTYINQDGAVYSCSPQGLLSFKRGIHADRIYVDDPLKDPDNKLAPTVILKINNVIKLEIYAMVNKGGKCRVVGTPQTNSDFFFDDELATKFSVQVLDAMVDEANRIALFPEWKSFDELEAIRANIGEKNFNQEYRAKPAYSEDSYIERKRLIQAVDPELVNLARYEGKNDVVAGYDIGKHIHPAHFAVFERYQEDGQTKYRQLLSKWLDGWDYKRQLEYLVLAIKEYGIDVLRYDNTRSEFEGFAEQGLVPKQMKPVQFSLKSKNAMAVSMSSIILDGRASLINDKRQTEQILAVTSDLQAFESSEGHGDSFWSLAMALWEEKKKEYRVRVL